MLAEGWATPKPALGDGRRYALVCNVRRKACIERSWHSEQLRLGRWCGTGDVRRASKEAPKTQRTATIWRPQGD